MLLTKRERVAFSRELSIIEDLDALASIVEEPLFVPKETRLLRLLLPISSGPIRPSLSNSVSFSTFLERLSPNSILEGATSYL
jgi:hypothetical protein